MKNYFLISMRFLNIRFNNFISKPLLSLVLLLLFNISFIALPTLADQSVNTSNNQYSAEEIERTIQIAEAAESIKFTEEQAEEKALAKKLIASAEKLKRLKKEIEQPQQKIKKMEA